ncbi:MAG: hypothetical protein PHE83_12995 [Opitutaceae bacterium]|nr:hypothetical protein [Opitutaceae bacterium]
MTRSLKPLAALPIGVVSSCLLNPLIRGIQFVNTGPGRVPADR